MYYYYGKCQIYEKKEKITYSSNARTPRLFTLAKTTSIARINNDSIAPKIDTSSAGRTSPNFTFSANRAALQGGAWILKRDRSCCANPTS